MASPMAGEGAAVVEVTEEAVEAAQQAAQRKQPIRSRSLLSLIGASQHVIRGRLQPLWANARASSE